MPVIGFMMVGSIVFMAVGKVLPSIITSLARSVIFLLPLILILPHYWQLDGVWLAFPLADILTFLLTLLLLIPLLTEFRRRSKEHYYNGEDSQPGAPKTPEAREKATINR